jgi:hypothetical protein
MDNIKEKSLIDALSFCALRDLPAEDSDEYVWLRAIALVAKSDGLQSYVLVEKNEDDNLKVIKDFGNVTAIRKVLAVYPYLFLDSHYIPVFKTKTKEERLAWLQRGGVDTAQLEELSVKDLNKLIIRIAKKKALMNIK